MFDGKNGKEDIEQQPETIFHKFQELNHDFRTCAIIVTSFPFELTTDDVGIKQNGSLKSEIVITLLVWTYLSRSKC